MTCISIMRDKKGLVMGGDRRCAGNMGTAYSFPTMKIKKMNANSLIGAAGSGSMCQLIIGHFNTNTQDPLKYVTEMKEFLVGLGYHNSDGKFQVSEDTHCRVLYTIGDLAYEIEISDSGGISEIGYDPVPIPYAIGCGGKYAHAILLHEQKDGINKTKDMVSAMKISAQLSPGVDDSLDLVYSYK